MRSLKLRITLFILLQTISLAAAGAASVPDKIVEEVVKQKAIYDSRGAERPDGYVIDRSLTSYADLLPAEFHKQLSTLGPQDRWLDIGAGEGRAVLDYATAKSDVQPASLTERARARTTAISIEDRRTARWHEASASLAPKQIEYLFGRTFSEYSAEELGQFQIITDVIGAFSYTQSITRFMDKALGTLALNGSLFTVLQDVGWEAGTNKPHYPNAPFLTEIRKADGSDMKICQWLKSIGCVQVTCEAKTGFVPPIEVYHVRKVCDKVTIPDLALEHFEAGTPPERRFVMKGAANPVIKTGEVR
ncbi:MAG TPA: hypothetical protein VED01_15440 [Burkholderiales bacterium]|nr:hypothetical protein [Burkholderiales bacterium]